MTDHNSGRPSRHVLVTGGLGFIGSFVTESLVESGDRVTVVDSCVSSVIEPEDLRGPVGSITVVQKTRRGLPRRGRHAGRLRHGRALRELRRPGQHPRLRRPARPGHRGHDGHGDREVHRGGHPARQLLVRRDLRQERHPPRGRGHPRPPVLQPAHRVRPRQAHRRGHVHQQQGPRPALGDDPPVQRRRPPPVPLRRLRDADLRPAGPRGPPADGVRLAASSAGRSCRSSTSAASSTSTSPTRRSTTRRSTTWATPATRPRSTSWPCGSRR